MRLFLTAGNTQSPLDRVRCITNIFTGRTGGRIALEARARGHHVTLATSHPEVLAEMSSDGAPPASGPEWQVLPYRTFAELHALMEQQIRSGSMDAVIHAAAVSDYQLAGTYVFEEGTRFDPVSGVWASTTVVPRLSEVADEKIKSSYSELWLRLTPAVKLVDLVRSSWGFGGVLVKFKLEVGVADEQLRIIAEQSRRQSEADLICANTLDGMADWADIGPINGGFERVARHELPRRLLEEVEGLCASRRSR